MYNMRNNRSFGGSRYQYQTLPYGYEGTQASGLISKVMGLLAFSFLSATVGTFIGLFLNLGFGAYLMIVIAGFIPALVAALGLYSVIRQETLLPVTMSEMRLLAVLVAAVAMALISALLSVGILRRAAPADVF